MEEIHRISKYYQQQIMQEIKSIIIEVHETQVMSSLELDQFLKCDILSQLTQIKFLPNTNQEFNMIMLKFFQHSLELIKHLQYQTNICTQEDQKTTSKINCSDVNQLMMQIDYKDSQFINKNIKTTVQSDSDISELKMQDGESLVQIDINAQIVITKWQPDLMIGQGIGRKTFFLRCKEQSRKYNKNAVKQPVYLYKFDWLCLMCCNVNHNYRSMCHSCQTHKDIHSLIQAL